MTVVPTLYFTVDGQVAVIHLHQGLHNRQARPVPS